jgi:hypothetical protein
LKAVREVEKDGVSKTQTERESERETVGLYPNWRGSWPIAYSLAQCLWGLEVRRGRRIEKVYAVMGFVSR